MFSELKPTTDLVATGDSGLTHVPAHWGVRSMRLLIKSRSERDRTDLPLLSVARERGVFVRAADDDNHNVIPDDLTKYKLARKGDLVINKMKAWQGSLGLAPEDGIVSPAYYVYDFAIENRHFGQALLRSKPYVAMLGAASDGVRIGQWDLSVARFRELPVLIPPADEQAAIVKYLGHAHARIDRAIAAKRKLIALLEEQKQAIIHQAVTRGLDPSVPLKDSGIPWLGEIPAHWDAMPLSRCFASMVYGTSENARGDGPVTVIGMGDIRAGEVRVSGNGGLDAVPVGLELEPGDLLFNRTNSPNLVGKVGIYRNERSDDVSFASYLVRLRPLPSFTSQWLVALLNSPNFLRFAQGQALVSLHQANLNPRRYGRLTIPVPPANERTAIAAALEGAILAKSTIISTISREIHLLLEFRTRLTSDVVTGQVDVREVAATLPELTSEVLAAAADEFGDDDELIEWELEFAGADE